MWNDFLTRCLQQLGTAPCFRIYGKARLESQWRILEVFATPRRNARSRWPLCRATCITWTDRIIGVGWDFAERILIEQAAAPAARHYPVEVAGGRLRDPERRLAAGAGERATASEVLAHECGHSWQALRLGGAYLPLVGAVTLFREGPHFWNHFENQASELGQFGGLVQGSVCPDLMNRLALRPS
ncbi:MAG TPA: hypothetical protein VKU02_28615 [Gemmataceae bacterium]|nr:hypothetical protein [Gemmataceae bacterium]